MNESRIIKEYDDEFFICIRKSNIIDTIDDYIILDVEISEFRKSKSLYYSSLKRIRKAGMYVKNTVDNVFIPCLQCKDCYTPIDNFSSCLVCNLDFTKSSFFIPLYYLVPSIEYNILKSIYLLGLTEEFYRDQRTNVCNPFKQELLEIVYHPDNIEKLLKVHSIDWWDLDKYI